MKKKKKQNIILGIIAAVVIVTVVGLFYSAEQTRIKGFNFGNNLQTIQEELKTLQTDFQTEMKILEEGDSTTGEFLRFADNHIEEMEELLSKYEELEPPEAFASSVELFKFSTLSQLESDLEMIKFIETGEDGAKIRSDALMRDAFEYELSALEKYNAAKAGLDP